MPAIQHAGPRVPAPDLSPQRPAARFAGHPADFVRRLVEARRGPRVRRRVGAAAGTSSSGVALLAGGVGSGSEPVTVVVVSSRQSGWSGQPGSSPARTACSHAISVSRRKRSPIRRGKPVLFSIR